MQDSNFNGKVKIPVCQGDLCIVEVDHIADDGTITFAMRNTAKIGAEIKKDGNSLIVGHSETGHHHAISLAEFPNAAQLFGTENPLVSVLRMKSPATLRHFRDQHKHPPIQLPAKDFVVIKQREKRPEGWVAVVD